MDSSRQLFDMMMVEKGCFFVFRKMYEWLDFPVVLLG